MNKLNVCVSYNDLFKDLAYISCSSYKNKNIVVHMNQTSIGIVSGNTLGSTEWRDSLREKISFSNSIFTSMEYGEVICIADADVYCLNSDRVFELKKQIEDDDLDILGLTNWFEQYGDDNHPERLMINCGFFLLRKTERSKGFLNNVLSYNFRDFTFGEQDIINEIILRGDHGLKYKTVCPREFILGCYLDRVLSLGDVNISLIHTTCTENVRQKKAQLDNLMEKLGLEKINWNNPVNNKTEVIYYRNGMEYEYEKTNN